MNQIEAKKLMFTIQTEWGDKKFEVTDDRAALWSLSLQHLSLDDAMSALALYMRNGNPFPPRPSDLLNQIATEATGEVVVDAAWDEVLREVKRVGLHPMPSWQGGVRHEAPVRTFSSPLIEAAVEAVGWEEICMSEKPGIQRKSFKDALGALVERYKRDIRNHGPEAALAMLEARGSRKPADSGMLVIGDVIGGHKGLPEGDRGERRDPGNHQGGRTGGNELVDRNGPPVEHDLPRGNAGLVRIQRPGATGGRRSNEEVK